MSVLVPGRLGILHERSTTPKRQRDEAVWRDRNGEGRCLAARASRFIRGDEHAWEDCSTDRSPVYSTDAAAAHYHGRPAGGLYDVDPPPYGDVRAFVRALEGWVIDSLQAFRVQGETRCDRVGVWVRRPERGEGVEDKIAAIGIRLRRWISFHGLSLNVSPDLTHFDGIVPCGVRQHGVTSLVDLGRPVAMDDVDAALAEVFQRKMGAIRRISPPVAEPAAVARLQALLTVKFGPKEKEPEDATPLRALSS